MHRCRNLRFRSFSENLFSTINGPLDDDFEPSAEKVHNTSSDPVGGPPSAARLSSRPAWWSQLTKLPSLRISSRSALSSSSRSQTSSQISESLMPLIFLSEKPLAFLCFSIHFLTVQSTFF